MPRKPKQPKAAGPDTSRLAGLPHLTNLVIEGGKRPVGTPVRDGKRTFQPQMVFWQDAETQFIRGIRLIDPQERQDDGISEALEVLIEACTGPFPGVPAGNVVPMPQKGKRAGQQGQAPSMPQPQVGLPATIRVNDAVLAQAARDLLQPFGVTVEYAEQMSSFDETFQSLARFMGAGPEGGPSEPFTWDVAPELLSPLFKATASLWRRKPWDYISDYPPVAITLGEHGPEPGIETLYGVILDGEVTGIAFYYSPEALEQAMEFGEEMAGEDSEVDEAIAMLRQAGAPVDEVPQGTLRTLVSQLMDEANPERQAQRPAMGDALGLFFNERDELDPSYLDWLAERDLKYPSRQGVPMFVRALADQLPRQPNASETRALTLAIEALNQYLRVFGKVLENAFLPLDGEPFPVQVESDTGRITVQVTFPAPGFDLESDTLLEDEDEEEEPEEPPSPTATTTLYRFQVALEEDKEVWRRIEMRGDQTLNDLHNAIQDAFNWDNDHLYAFFLSGKAWDRRTAYYSPLDDERLNAARYRLEQLGLKPQKKFLYIFDFGDEWRHQITVEAITPRGVQAGARYPRITESHGNLVPQYPYAEDDEEDYEDEEDEGLEEGEDDTEG